MVVVRGRTQGQHGAHGPAAGGYRPCVAGRLGLLGVVLVVLSIRPGRSGT